MNQNEQEQNEYQRLISKRCKTCNHCKNLRCKVHNRQIDPDFNKCLYHSDNAPKAKAKWLEENYNQLLILTEQNKTKTKKGTKAA